MGTTVAVRYAFKWGWKHFLFLKKKGYKIVLKKYRQRYRKRIRYRRGRRWRYKWVWRYRTRTKWVYRSTVRCRKGLVKRLNKCFRKKSGYRLVRKRYRQRYRRRIRRRIRCRKKIRQRYRK